MTSIKSDRHYPIVFGQFEAESFVYFAVIQSDIRIFGSIKNKVSQNMEDCLR